ncbi:beta-N-acetylhexosaminidase [Lederbergia panacisoli]|uniref:beta-N-acetylhexosaminidase n=1 Tax=Lederbergia panacisoli TaxID=1255251 RepID=UPI00214C737F|nr:beta-N-acetylhexosaminidase [Lederbergia panacisoli]MCR2821707.1 beta-N-acetylhexosaminidase [Lederbergia panacisoli]
MKLQLIGDLTRLEQGINALADKFNFSIDENGLPIKVIKSQYDKLEVVKSKNVGSITYSKDIHFFRALGLFLEACEEKDEFHIVEEPQFDRNGLFFDVSQGNAVMNINTVKEILTRMSVMGLNWLILYMEDSFEVKDEPFFGYMRGKYTYEDLKAIDDYAFSLGIEVIPCIQTLAHLQEVMKWPRFNSVREDEATLLVGEPQTYELIENLLSTVSAPFRSKRIHLGLDEAWKLGLGEYLNRNGLKSKFEIMTEHINHIVKITEKLELTPMMFSDMYFRTPRLTGYGNNFDVDAQIPEEIVSAIPKGMQMNFWEYNRDDQPFYETIIEKHRSLNVPTIVCGGIYSCFGFGVNYGIAFRASNAILNASKKKEIKEVFLTHWGDDGTESQIFSAMLGWQLYAEHGYSRELDMEKLKRRFEFCTGGNFDDFISVKYIDEVPGTSEDNTYMCNPSKYLLWQNILAGLFDKNIEGLNLGEHYAKLAERMHESIERNGEFDYVFTLLEKVSSVLAIKAEIGLQITSAYKGKRNEELQRLSNETLKELKSRVEDLRLYHRDIWFKTNKAFGWEIIDLRYGALLANIDTATKRLNDYVSGKIAKIEELEEERLMHPSTPDLPLITGYKGMPSASRMSQ